MSKRSFFLFIFIVILFFGMQYFRNNIRREKVHTYILSLPNVKKVDVTDNDDIFEWSYDASVTLKNGDKIELESINVNFNTKKTILASINHTTFIYFLQGQDGKWSERKGLPLRCLQDYLEVDMHTVSLFFSNYDNIKDSVELLENASFDVDIYSKRGMIGWGIDEKNREYYMAKYGGWREDY